MPHVSASLRRRGAKAGAWAAMFLMSLLVSGPKDVFEHGRQLT
jgi:hypothetical protein